MDEPNQVDLYRMAQQHLDSLRAGGVEWLPRTCPDETSGAVDVARQEESRTAAPGEAQAEMPGLFAAESTAPPQVGLSLEQRRTELQVLIDSVASCRRCPELAATRTQTVFGVGPLDVDLCLVGEAPGADEDAQGKPFVGAAGQLLTRILAACGLKREEVYICNTLKCRPPGNRTPLASETGNCRSYLELQLELIRPKFICALGGSAAQQLLGTTLSLGKLRGRIHDYQGIPVMVTYHPSYLLPHRDPSKKKDVWQDMKMLMARMGRTIPERT
jgi:DNA polymerase